MHEPLRRNEKTEIGITGNVKTRKQVFTGLQIMQVECVIMNEFYIGTRLKSRTYKTTFRDATEKDAFKIEYGINFVTKPENETFDDYDKEIISGYSNVKTK